MLCGRYENGGVSGWGRWEEGRTACEGKQILKFNTFARKQVKNGRAFKGCVVFRQREICFTCSIPLFERNKCVYRVPKQIGGSEGLNDKEFLCITQYSRTQIYFIQ